MAAWNEELLTEELELWLEWRQFVIQFLNVLNAPLAYYAGQTINVTTRSLRGFILSKWEQVWFSGLHLIFVFIHSYFGQIEVCSTFALNTGCQEGEQ